MLNARLVPNITTQSAYIELLYPTIYKFSCPLNLHYFPFDSQVCKMTFGSWTYDNVGIDYKAYSDNVGTSNYLENEGWSVKSFKGNVVSRRPRGCDYSNKSTSFGMHAHLIK